MIDLFARNHRTKSIYLEWFQITKTKGFRLNETLLIGKEIELIKANV